MQSIPPTRIILLRHGHVDGIIPKRFRGRLDLPLSSSGESQASQAAAYLVERFRFAAAYSSPLSRCLRTAQPLMQAIGMAAPVIHDGFQDIDYGQWQGELASDMSLQYPCEYALWQQHPEQLSFPGGESLPQVAERATAALHEVAARHSGKDIVIVSHDSVIRVVILSALAAPLSAYHRIQIDPCFCTELQVLANAAVDVVRINQATGSTE